MRRKRSNISRHSPRSIAVKLSRRKQKDDVEKLELEVHETRVRLAGMHQKYAEYLASQEVLEASEKTVTPQDKIETLKTEISRKEINVVNTTVGNS